MRRFTTVCLFASVWLRFWIPASAQTLAPRPRINLTPARIAALKALANSTNPRWVALKAAADAALPAPTSADVPGLALVYALTGTASYGNAAITAAMKEAAQAVGAANVSGDSWYNMRSTYMSVVRAYDWCYPLLSATQKATLAKWLMDTAAACWNRPGGWSVADPDDNYFYGFCYTGMAGLACLGDEIRAQSEIDRWKLKFDTMVAPVLQGHSRGGAWIESNSYGLYNSNMLAVQVDAYQTATGTDISTNQAAGSFFGQVCTYTLHGTTPDLSYREPFGSQSRSSIPSLMEYDRDAVLPAANLAGGTFLSDVKTWLNITPQPGMAIRAWSELLWYPDNILGTDYRATQPNNYFAPGMGVFLYRQNWNPGATEWNVWSGPFTESHEDANCNGFQVFKGSTWLVPSANIYSAAGTLGESYGTIAFNNITISGHGQRLPSSGTTLVHEVGPDYVNWSGQASGCYTADTPITHVIQSFATDVTRKILYIPDADLFIISDRVAKVNAADATEFHLHSKSQPAISGSSYSWDNGTAKLWGVALTGTVGSISEPYGSGGTISSYRTDVGVGGGTTTDRLLNVLQITALSGNALPVSVIPCNTHNITQVGKWVLGVGRTESVSGSVQYTFNGTGSTEHVLTDLLPSTVYQGSTSSAAGTLRFSMPAGTSTITLTPGPTPTPIDYKALYTAEVAAHLADNTTNAAAIATLTGNLATAIAQRDALQKKLDALAAALKAVLGIP